MAGTLRRGGSGAGAILGLIVVLLFPASLRAEEIEGRPVEEWITLLRRRLPEGLRVRICLLPPAVVAVPAALVAARRHFPSKRSQIQPVTYVHGVSGVSLSATLR